MSLEKGIYRSNEEVYFSWYLDELIKYGYVSWYKYESRKFKLLDEVKGTWDRKLKNGKVVATELHLLQDVEYTPDFEICFTEKALGIFCTGIPSRNRPYFVGVEVDPILNEYIVLVDVKGKSFINATSSISFSFTQKLMWDKLKIYVQKVVPQSLFNKTFTPSRYLYTDGGGAFRNSKTMKNVVNIKDYVKKIQ